MQIVWEGRYIGDKWLNLVEEYNVMNGKQESCNVFAKMKLGGEGGKYGMKQ